MAFGDGHKSWRREGKSWSYSWDRTGRTRTRGPRQSRQPRWRRRGIGCARAGAGSTQSRSARVAIRAPHPSRPRFPLRRSVSAQTAIGQDGWHARHLNPKTRSDHTTGQNNTMKLRFLNTALVGAARGRSSFLPHPQNAGDPADLHGVAGAERHAGLRQSVQARLERPDTAPARTGEVHPDRGAPLG